MIVPFLSTLLSGLRLMALGTALFAVAKVVAALAISVAVYTGVNQLFDLVETHVLDNMTLLGDVAAIAGMMGVDVGVSLILSAMSLVLSYRLVSGVAKSVSFGFLGAFQ